MSDTQLNVEQEWEVQTMKSQIENLSDWIPTELQEILLSQANIRSMHRKLKDKRTQLEAEIKTASLDGDFDKAMQAGAALQGMNTVEYNLPPIPELPQDLVNESLEKARNHSMNVVSLIEQHLPRPLTNSLLMINSPFVANKASKEELKARDALKAFEGRWTAWRTKLLDWRHITTGNDFLAYLGTGKVLMDQKDKLIEEAQSVDKLVEIGNSHYKNPFTA